MAPLFSLATGLLLAAWPWHKKPHAPYPAQYFAGSWSCHPKRQPGFSLKFTETKRVLPKNKKNLPSYYYDVLATGPSAKKLPATAAAYSADRGNSSVLISGNGACGAPAITDEDDEPTSGAPRCSRFEAHSWGWENDVLTFEVHGTRISGKQYELALLITRASAKHFAFSVRDGKKLLAEGDCSKR
jgi:hypothetical protein